MRVLCIKFFVVAQSINMFKSYTLKLVITPVNSHYHAFERDDHVHGLDKYLTADYSAITGLLW